MNDYIFIYGPPGVGKSTIGKLLASALNMPFIDLDDEIIQTEKKSISNIFSEDGETYFRSLEQAQLSRCIGKIPSVISLGGGALLDPQNRELVEKKGQVVLLNGSSDVLLKRLSDSDSIRPLIAKDISQKLENLLSKRKAHYDSFQLRYDTDGQNPEDISWEIQKLLGKFFMTGMGNGYPVNVKCGGIANLGQELALLHDGRSVILITDENVGPLYSQNVTDSLEQAGFEVHVHMIKAGEAQKNLETITQLWNTFTNAKLDRRGLVVAIGGGVVGDMAGFAAATYMRGINWVNVPSSLLAMVDSSIGGKTAFDLPQGKNLIGAFHSPIYVLIDPDLLATLPEKEYKNGMGEVVKHAIISSKGLLDLCQRNWDNSSTNRERFINEALSVKVEMVQKDPYEKGVRAALNLGHTVGHAVELLSNFDIPHGYAVAIGMVAEAKLALHSGLATQAFVDKLIDVLTQLELPTEIPNNMDRAKIIETMRLDKKNTNKSIRFSLPKCAGQVKTGVVIENLEDVFADI